MMAPLLLRLFVLAAGLGTTEVALGQVFVDGSGVGWVLLVLGVVEILAGSAGFMAPILAGRSMKEASHER